MKSKRILITGASGCVGHYIVEDLVANSPHRLVLVLRDPAKVAIDPAWRDRMEVIEGDMGDIDRIARLPGDIDAAVLAAAAWGGEEAFRVNRDANLALAEHLLARGCRRILYYSSASVLDRDGGMLKAADEMGTEYIRSKYSLVEEMETLETRAAGAQIVGLFPTLVIGGDPDKPVSHFARLLRQATRWAWLAKRFKTDGRFHVIHARDIAIVTRKLVDLEAGETPPRRIVLGNPALRVNEFIAGFAEHLGKRVGITFNLTQALAETLIRLFRIELSPWDRYCMENRDLSFRDARNPAAFGEEVFAPDLSSALTSIGIPRRR